MIFRKPKDTTTRHFGPWSEFIYFRCCGRIESYPGNLYSVCPNCGSNAPFSGREKFIGRRVTRGIARTYECLQVKLKDGNEKFCHLDSEIVQLFRDNRIVKAF